MKKVIDKEIKMKIENGEGFITLGNTLISNNIRNVREGFSQLEEYGVKTVYVEMGLVERIDSSGVSLLVMYLKRYKNAGIKMKLMHLRNETERILKLVNLIDYFDIEK